MDTGLLQIDDAKEQNNLEKFANLTYSYWWIIGNGVMGTTWKEAWDAAVRLMSKMLI